MQNGITVDVEDWFQVSIFRNLIDFKDWDKQESRILQNIMKVIALFDEFGVKGTFFVLGWTAERFPKVVELIKQHGHEIGSHGYAHRMISEQSKDEFASDLEKSIKILKDIIQEDIRFYRAPNFSINKECMWAFQELSDQGIEYDSSVYPIKHDIGGMPGMPRFPFFLKFKNGNILKEFPLSTLRFMGENLPMAGGGYLRLLPFWFIKGGIRKNNKEGLPVIFYFHPWELDPDQPRQKIKFISRFRHYTNLDLTEHRLRELLKEFKFTTLGEVSKSYKIECQWPQITANGHVKKSNLINNA